MRDLVVVGGGIVGLATSFDDLGWLLAGVGGLLVGTGAALAARALRPGLETTAAFVDVQPPTVVDVVAGLAGRGRAAVVVPVLSSGRPPRACRTS